MRATNTDRPQVPGGLHIPDQGSGRKRKQIWGAKNHRDRAGYHRKTTLAIGTINVRTLIGEDRLYELEEELNKIKWDIVGLAEIRRKGEECMTLRSGHILYYKGAENESQRGVGFIINRKISAQIIKFDNESERVASIIIQLSPKYTIKIIQCYAPTSTHTDEEMEAFYNEISDNMKKDNTTHTLVIGDFNSKVGKRQEENEEYIGNFSYDERNERGSMLLEFLTEHRLYEMNSFFSKKQQRKWTWISPDLKNKNEIDYILSSEKQIVQDVTTLNSFNINSDHRLVRAKISIDTKKKRRPWTKKEKIITKIDTEKLKRNALEYSRELNKQLKKEEWKSNDINKMNDIITNAMNQAGKKVAKMKNSKIEKLSQNTKNKIEEKRQLFREGKYEEFRQMAKETRRMIRRDLQNYYEIEVEKLIEENRGIKCLRRNGKRHIITLTGGSGREVRNLEEIIKETERFYTNLYDTKTQQQYNDTTNERKIINVGSEEMPEITTEELKYALKQMKNNRAPGEDGIMIEMIKEGEEEILTKIRDLFNICLEKGEIPKNWNNASMILVHKKGDQTNLENYRPLSILSQLYKTFTKVVTNRVTKKLEEYQPIEQAGFRRDYSTSEHLLTMRILIEKSVEYNFELNLAFVDFQKAFDTVEHWAIMKSLRNARIDHRYIRLLENIYKNATSTIHLHENTNPISIKRGIRQGDTLSPKLFTNALEDVFKQLHWQNNKGILINGKRLNNLRFADDIVLIAETPEQLQIMLTELDKVSSEIGLNMNLTKTKVMCSRSLEQKIKIKNQELEEVDSYVYLGHMLKLGRENQKIEIYRRRRLAWAAFGKLSKTLKNRNIPMHLRSRVFDQCVLPVLTYGAQTWTLIKQSMSKLRVTQRAMERQMLGITLRDHRTNCWIRSITKVKDVAEAVAELKWNYAGHVARYKDERWTNTILKWRPYLGKRFRGRPPMRWTDDIKRSAGLMWIREAQDRDRWQRMREAYVQKWTEE